MNNVLLPFFLFLPFFAPGQITDTTVLEKQVDSLIERNRTLVWEQEFDAALQLIEEAERLVKGKISASFARCLYNHGRTFYYAGRSAEAAPFFQRALEIQEKDPGKEHADYSYSLTGLANAFMELGRYEEAKPLYVESKDIRERVFGPEHRAYASALNNLAILHWELGEFGKAEPLLLESKATRERTLGRDHPDYAASLNNLAILYTDMGQYDKAEKLHLEGIEIKALVLGPDHADYATSLNSLAALYYEIGNYKKAEPLYLECKAIQEKVFGRENADYISTLGNLADIYKALGQYEQSELLHLENIDGREKISGTDHPDYAVALNYLGNLYWILGDHEKATPLFEQSRIILEAVLGTETSEYIRVLQGLADCHEIQQHTEKSENLLLEIADLQQSRLDKAVSFLSEKELEAYTKLFKNDVNRAFNFIRFRTLRGLPTGSLSSLCYNNILFYKGYLLTSVRQANTLVASHPETNELNNQLKSYRRLLSQQYAYPLMDRDSSAIILLEEKTNTVEKQLAKKLADYAEAKTSVNWKMVQANLKPGEAAIEFVHFPYNFPQASDSLFYTALVLRADVDQPVFIPLFEGKQLIDRFATNAKRTKDQNINQLYNRGASTLQMGDLTDLYEMLWERLQSHLSDINTIYYAPSGLLHRISFDAIPINAEQRLSDRFQLVRLGSTRSIALPEKIKSSEVNDIILYGGIRYNLDTASHSSVSLPGDKPALETDSQLPFVYTHRGILSRGQQWNYLQGTEKEASSIATLLDDIGFSTRLFSGDIASEENFKAIADKGRSPRILHIATHGFFFPDPNTVSDQNNSGTGTVAFQISDHPMIRSGLLLTGANYAWLKGKPWKPDREDGILTAYEISQMNLANTELVVLSACETGLGDIEGNEGVYGLQRAFKIAGVQSLIMSLWKVPDEPTAELMIRFYTYWQQDGMPVRKAFHQAQREFREAGMDPYLWAGFVLLQ